MTTIQNFQKIRRDGKVIYESMKVKDLIALGWQPDIIVELQWSFGSKLISLTSKYGFSAKVVPGREFVAIMEDIDQSTRVCSMYIVNSDGSRRFEISNMQRIGDAEVEGEFRWFEPARLDSAHVFGAVFCRRTDDALFQMDIDAASGRVIGVYPTR